jgi:hypothetical protein
MATTDDKPPAFKVTDRRSFTGEGEEAAAPSAPAPSAAAPRPAPDQETPRALPPVDFSTFVVSLGSSALMHLGELEEPGSGKTEKDLPLAKHTIDLLTMLQGKTKGNLTPGEEKLLESLLYDLRIRFVEAAK